MYAENIENLVQLKPCIMSLCWYIALQSILNCLAYHSFQYQCKASELSLLDTCCMYMWRRLLCVTRLLHFLACCITLFRRQNRPQRLTVDNCYRYTKTKLDNNKTLLYYFHALFGVVLEHILMILFGIFNIVCFFPYSLLISTFCILFTFDCKHKLWYL